MVSAIVDGSVVTASELAFAARITAQTASTHLAKLTAAGVVAVVRTGRHRSLRLASPTAADMIDGIVAVALAKTPRYHPLSPQGRALSAARICYEHLAGRLSVDLTDAFVAFFFSSRRRHTRYWRDWSSDVCSSDLPRGAAGVVMACTVDEEHTFTGVSRLARGGLRADGAVVAEPTQLKIVNAHKGVVQIGRASCREGVEKPAVAVSCKINYDHYSMN